MLCRSDDVDIVHLKSYLVKRRSQPMEVHRPKRLLDQVRDAIRLWRIGTETCNHWPGSARPRRGLPWERFGIGSIGVGR